MKSIRKLPNQFKPARKTYNPRLFEKDAIKSRVNKLRTMNSTVLQAAKKWREAGLLGAKDYQFFEPSAIDKHRLKSWKPINTLDEKRPRLEK